MPERCGYMPSEPVLTVGYTDLTMQVVVICQLVIGHEVTVRSY